LQIQFWDDPDWASYEVTHPNSKKSGTRLGFLITKREREIQTRELECNILQEGREITI
jgi:hypothetical protein